MTRKDTNAWALILGVSSGFGAAAARELARNGYNILGVHLDRQATMPAVTRLVHDIERCGQKAVFYNMNAADEKRRHEVLDTFVDEHHKHGKAEIRVLFHSLAFGTLKPLVGRNDSEMITRAQLEMTLDVMANSLVYWTQDCARRGLIGRGTRIFTMTSDGANLQLPYYGAVSAAKAAVEAYIRQLALELGPRGIICNALLAGVTDTPALNKIPGARNMLFAAKAKNPMGRVTTPEDVARAVMVLMQPGAEFINGNTIGVDGGESKISYVGQRNSFQYSDLNLLAESTWDPTDVS
ncbi:MAG: SDR family oxidoreductase [Ignavibacteriae bacterium]|nr:SDR family oxidoreductase [Ignavibacteriota bacterium]